MTGETVAAPTYQAIPEGQGWLILNLATDEPAQFNGRPLVDLPFEAAEQVTELLNNIEVLLATILAAETEPSPIVPSEPSSTEADV